MLSQQRYRHETVRVEVDMEELESTSAEAKATYKEIQEYVLEQHGMKVSSLYISQIKRKCRLEVGEHYNQSKNKNARVPNCPPGKEEAIIDALKHFKMIS